MKKAINRRMPARIATVVFVVLLLTQLPCFAAWNSVPTKMFPKVTGVEIVWENSPSLEMHIRFTNNVSAIDEEQVREIVNPPDGNFDYMTGINARNLTKFHLVEKDHPDVELECTVTPHPEAKKQTEESRWFYVYADNLDPGKDYEVHIDEDLYANMGNSLGTAYTITFNLGQQTCTFGADGEIPEDAAAETPLTLDMTSIENNEKDVPADLELVLRFCFNVSGPEIIEYNAAQLSLVYADDASRTVPITVSAGGAVQEIIIRSVEPLESGTEYRLIIAKEFSGRNLRQLASPLNLYFTVEGEKQEPSGDEDDPTGDGTSTGSGDGTSTGSGSGTSTGSGSGTSTGSGSGTSTGSGSGTSTGSGSGTSTGSGSGTSTENGSGTTTGSGDGIVNENPNVDVKLSGNGTVTVETTEIQAEDTVVFEVTPDSGFQLDSIIVLNSEGNELVLTEQDGKYLFTMPESDVTIQVTFVEEEEIEDYFSDIESSWARKDINLLADLGVVEGSDGMFRPDSQITRAEIVTLLVRFYDLDSETTVSFADTKNHWAQGYISIAASLGYVNGYSVNAFGPDDSLTREQMAVILMRIEDFTPDTSEENAPPFSDMGSVSDWAVAGVTAAFQNGIINGYSDGTFHPLDSITRAEVCHMIVNLLEIQQQVV